MRQAKVSERMVRIQAARSACSADMPCDLAQATEASMLQKTQCLSSPGQSASWGGTPLRPGCAPVT